MTADKRLQFEICLSEAETEATTWSLADPEPVKNQLEREIHSITSNGQMQYMKEFSFRSMEFEPWWEKIGIQVPSKAIEQHIIYFGYPKMHVVSHLSELIRRMGSCDNFTTDIAKRLHIAKVKKAYRSSKEVNYIPQMLKQNARCTGIDYMEETLSYLALQGWYDIDSAKVFNLLSATDKRQGKRRAHVLHLQTIQNEAIIRTVSQQVYHLREPPVRIVCRSIISTSHRDTSEDSGLSNIGQLVRVLIEDDWGHEVSGLMLGYDQNVLLDSIFIKLQNGLLYYRQPFHYPTCIKRLGLDCWVEYTNANQGIMPEAHNIWVQYTQSEENDLNNTFQGQIPSFPVLYISWTPLNQIVQFQKGLPYRKAISTFSKRCKKTQQWVLCQQVQEYVVVIPIKFNDLHGWADCVDGFIWVVKQMNKMSIVPIIEIVGPGHLVRENAATGGIDSPWLVNNHVDLDTYWTVY